ncbi:MAG: hypothetical protein KF716_09850 [Anaerolineae bacterium]|nr:hypothetical protein [Anaerolineae bacterium]
MGISDDQWERMQQVERVFRAAPMVDAPPDLVDKVMLTIASKQFDDMNKPSSGGSTKGGGSGKLLGGRKLLFFLSMITGPILTTLLVVAAVQAGVLNDVVRQLVLWYNDIGQRVAWLWQSLSQVAPTNILMPLLLTVAVGMVAAWVWVMNYLASHRQQVVYHIPVNYD